MEAALLIAMAVLPLGMAALPLLPCTLLVCPPTRRWGLRLAPWTPLPALVLALAPVRWETIDLPWLLIGTRLGLDETGRAFLLLTAVIWWLAGLFLGPWWGERPGRLRYTAFFLATQAGNLGLCVAQDAGSFYLFFALMTFGAYGLVAEGGGPAARRAARAYLALALLGEMLVLAGLMLLSHAAGSHLLPELRTNTAGHALLPLAALLVFLGFGAKTGLPLLHVALPPAYAAAPAPGAAVLAGAMIKAGVLGWLRFLPLGGEAPLPLLGEAAIVTGLLMAFAGALLGLLQRLPGALLAYSSISQMGYFTVALGAALLAPAWAPAIGAALVLYALHHAFAKAALFLGVAVAQRHGAPGWVLAGLGLPALALAGAPLTSGALAKIQLKAVLAGLPAPWSAFVPTLLSVAAVGTALLMARLLWLVQRSARGQGRRPREPLPPVALLAWTGLVAAGIGIPAALAPDTARLYALEPGAMWDAAWPVLAALLVTTIAIGLRLRATSLPPGDLLVPVEAVLGELRQTLHRPTLAPPPAPELPWRRSLWHRLEAGLRLWPTVGLVWLVVLGWVFLGLLR